MSWPGWTRRPASMGCRSRHERDLAGLVDRGAAERPGAARIAPADRDETGGHARRLSCRGCDRRHQAVWAPGSRAHRHRSGPGRRPARSGCSDLHDELAASRPRPPLAGSSRPHPEDRQRELRLDAGDRGHERQCQRRDRARRRRRPGCDRWTSRKRAWCPGRANPRSLDRHHRQPAAGGPDHGRDRPAGAGGE